MSFSHLTFLYADVMKDILVQDSFMPAEIDEVIDLTDIELWVDGGSVPADSNISEDGTRPESLTPYHARLRNGGSISRTFDTTARRNIQLKYFWQGDADVDEVTDVLSVYWKKSSDTEFILLTTQILDSTEWSEAVLDFPAEADDTSIDVQFVGNTNRDEEEARVDDVSLEGEIIDRDAPILAETTPVVTPSKDRTPDITLYTTEGGSISITGHCRSSIATLEEADNTFHLLFEEEVDEMHYFKIDELGSFPDGYFSNCIVTVTDAAGNISLPLSLTPFFVDGTSPEITVEPYTTAPTNSDITVTVSTNEGTLNTSSHTFSTNGSFTFTATDDAGNVTNRIVTITNIDKTAPTINLIGASIMDVAQGTSYTESGAICSDNSGDDCDIIIDNASVDTGTLGVYEVTYTATDEHGNMTIVTRTVHVVEEDMPIITLLGNSTVTIGQFEPYGDAGATALDKTDGDITEDIIIDDPLNTEMTGTYIITYDVVDSEGNPARQITRTVYVVDKTGPNLSEVEPIAPTTSHTPSYSFSSSDPGTITYGGACFSDETSAIDDINTVTFDTLPDGVYSDCSISVTDIDGNTSTLNVTAFTIDSTPPELIEVHPVTTPANDVTPSYTFSSSEAGTLTYGGDCSSSTTSAVAGNNTITFDTLADGVYDDCTMTITDSVGFTDVVTIPVFIIDTLSPLVSDLNSVTFLPPGVTFTWITNKPATTRIEYGTSASYGSSLIVEMTSTATHTATITGLLERTTYHYRFISTDDLGNVTLGEDATFTTPGTTNNNTGSSGGSFIPIVSVPVEPVTLPIFIPLPTIPEPREEDVPTIPPVSPINPVIPVNPQPINVPIRPTSPIFEGGGVTPSQINTPTFIPTSVPVDIGGGVLPEGESYNFLWIFLILFGALNYWWFFIAKRDEEEDEEKKTVRRKRK